MHPSYGPNGRPSQDAFSHASAPLRHARFEVAEMAPTVNQGGHAQDTKQFRLTPRHAIPDSYCCNFDVRRLTGPIFYAISEKTEISEIYESVAGHRKVRIALGRNGNALGRKPHRGSNSCPFVSLG